jgi:hypothetical protein
VESSNCITFEIFRFDFSGRKVNVLHRPSFIFLLLLHLLFRDLQSDDEVCPLRGQNFIDVVKVKILFGSFIPLEAEHQFSLLLHTIKLFVEVVHGFYDVCVPEGLVLAELLDQFDRLFEGELLDDLRQQFEEIELDDGNGGKHNIRENELLCDSRRFISGVLQILSINNVKGRGRDVFIRQKNQK